MFTDSSFDQIPCDSCRRSNCSRSRRRPRSRRPSSCPGSSGSEPLARRDDTAESGAGCGPPRRAAAGQTHPPVRAHVAGVDHHRLGGDAVVSPLVDEPPAAVTQRHSAFREQRTKSDHKHTEISRPLVPGGQHGGGESLNPMQPIYYSVRSIYFI